nr:hypothetical protein [uncultured Carboxylicivirga sp.]
MKKRIKDTNTTLSTIAIYQIIGGVFGIGLVGWLMLRTGQINGPILFILLFATFLFGLSIYSGNLLFRTNRQKEGLIYSSFLQGLQIISFGMGGYAYEFFSGANATVGINLTNGFEFKISAALSTFTFNLNSGVNYFIKINILAIIILVVLIDIYEELYKKKPENDDLAAETIIDTGLETDLSE